MIENTKHTPGPWVVSSGEVYTAKTGIPIARMRRDTPDTTPTERDSNAQLIAATPELLLALDSAWLLLCNENVRYLIRNKNGEAALYDATERKIRTAIRKARGK